MTALNFKKFYCYDAGTDDDEGPEDGQKWVTEYKARNADDAAEAYVEDTIDYGDYANEVKVDVVEEDGTLHELLVTVDYSPTFNVYERD